MTDERNIAAQEPAVEEPAVEEPTAGEPVEPEEALAQDAATEDAPQEPDWKDLALRKAAELENVRKQNAQRVQKASRDGMRRVAGELLPALDDFERALAHAEAEEEESGAHAAEGGGSHHLTAGIRLVQQKMIDALRRAGIEPYSPKGEPFDPHLHEAVAQQAADGTEPGIVLEVVQNGYRLGDDVLRPARVVVAG
ncbi:MAG TPA: nucleotide exchange factor GrpE [Solirubrobacteraceae bacterium]|nr:nucleotide exchange factor GrpE [Solirubrobacteraceae bacterium]